MGKILFGSKYPVLFTCENEGNVYLFICCLANSDKLVWIATQTDYKNLIDLLENKITIRAAFLNVTDKKMIITYDGQKVECKEESYSSIPMNYLPTEGEYMDAEDDEYKEELVEFRKRCSRVEFTIKPRRNSYWTLDSMAKVVEIAEDYFNMDLGSKNVMQYKIGEIYNQNYVLV